MSSSFQRCVRPLMRSSSRALSSLVKSWVQASSNASNAWFLSPRSFSLTCATLRNSRTRSSTSVGRLRRAPRTARSGPRSADWSRYSARAASNAYSCRRSISRILVNGATARSRAVELLLPHLGDLEQHLDLLARVLERVGAPRHHRDAVFPLLLAAVDALERVHRAEVARVELERAPVSFDRVGRLRQASARRSRRAACTRLRSRRRRASRRRRRSRGAAYRPDPSTNRPRGGSRRSRTARRCSPASRSSTRSQLSSALRSRCSLSYQMRPRSP